MALSLDGNAHGSSTTATTATATLTTSLTNDVIIAFVEVSHPTNAPSVTSVAGGGLTWTKRQTKSMTFTANTAGKLVAEEWWAPSTGALTAQVITVTGAASGTPDHCNIIVFGVTGCNNINAPFDSNGGLPVSYNSPDTGGNKDPTNAGSDRPTLSTTQAHSMVIGYNVCISVTTDRADVASVAWTQIAQENNAGGTDWSNAVAEEFIFSTVQTGLAVSFRDAENNYIILGDALTADSTAVATTTIAQTLPSLTQLLGSTSGNVTTISQTLAQFSQVVAGHVPPAPGTGTYIAGWTAGP
jgi:hypothetical protein